jgi:NAD+ diphosphatase
MYGPRTYKYCPLCTRPLEIADCNGTERLVCPGQDCRFIYWENPTPVVAAIVEHNDQVVLVRSIGRPSTWYGLVAGFLEKAEHPDDAMLREIDEEVGLKPTRCTFLGAYDFARMNQIIFAYHAEVPHLDIRLCQKELDDYRIVPVGQLKPWAEGTGPALRDWLKTRGLNPSVVDFGKHI